MSVWLDRCVGRRGVASMPTSSCEGRSVFVCLRQALIRSVDRTRAHSRMGCLWVDAIEEWNKYGLFHQLVDLAHGEVECLWLGRQLFCWDLEQRVTHVRRQIDLARAVWPDVGVDQARPESSDIIPILARRLIIFTSSGHHLGVVLLVSPSIHREFQSLQTVVVG